MDQQSIHERFAAAKTFLGEGRRILISGHRSPDGDSLGSMIALARMLRAAGHDAVATADVRALGKPGFLEGVADLLPVRKLRRRRFDVFFYVDCSTPDRLPPERESKRERVIFSSLLFSTLLCPFPSTFSEFLHTFTVFPSTEILFLATSTRR